MPEISETFKYYRFFKPVMGSDEIFLNSKKGMVRKAVCVGASDGLRIAVEAKKLPFMKAKYRVEALFKTYPLTTADGMLHPQVQNSRNGMLNGTFYESRARDASGNIRFVAYGDMENALRAVSDHRQVSELGISVLKAVRFAIEDKN